MQQYQILNLYCPYDHSILTEIVPRIDTINRNGFVLTIQKCDELELISEYFASQNQTQIMDYLVDKKMPEVIRRPRPTPGAAPATANEELVAEITNTKPAPKSGSQIEQAMIKDMFAPSGFDLATHDFDY